MISRLSSILFTTFLFSSIITTALVAAIINLARADAPIQRCDMSAIGYVIGWLGVIILTLGTTPVYFNLMKEVRQSNVLSLLSFFLLPVGMAVWFLFSFQATSLMVSVPYLSILTVQFIRFKKQTHL